MDHFYYRDNELFCEDVPVRDIIRVVGTPLYLYSHETLRRHFRAIDDAFGDTSHITCFSMKSNSSQAVLRLFAREGGGADIVSGGELFRALRAGVRPEKIVYSGVGKRSDDLEYALKSHILIFNVESGQELERLERIAGRLGKKARVALRVNPDVDPKTHAYISTGLRENKFGIDIKEAPEQYSRAAGMKNLVVSGVSCHIGSQLTQVSPFEDALDKLMGLIHRLRDSGLKIDYLDIGGGLGIKYHTEEPPLPKEYARAVKDKLRGEALTLLLEPGRVVMGNAGILLCELLYTKSSPGKTFYVVDAAMNDLMRPALYEAYHGIQPVTLHGRGSVTVDVVGPICESGDFFAKEREMEAMEPGEYMAVMSAGAYGFSMSSNYNSRPRACEVMVRGDRFTTIRARETYEDLVRGESIPDFLSEA